jgi:hypothetical protein
MLTKMKSWLKNEDSQLSSENGMLIALAVVIIVLVIGPFVWKAIQGGYDTILARFKKASSNADVDSWNKK